MKKIVILFSLLFLLYSNLYAQESSEGIQTWIEEEDGSPSIIVYKFKVPNSTLTDNGDSTASLFKSFGDIDQLNTTPHHTFVDTDTNDCYTWHLDTGAGGAPYNNFTLWRGTWDGTDCNVNPAVPLLYLDNSNDWHFDNDTFVIDSVNNIVDVSGGSLKIQNGANPTVDVAGKIAVDTTDDQLIYYGGAERVIPYSFTKCAVIENLAAADDNKSLGMFNDAVTITSVGIHCDGTCTTAADIDLSDRAGNAMTHGAPTVSTTTGNTTFTAVTAANGLAAGEGLEFSVANAVSPETDTYTICVTGTYDRQ